MSSIVLDVGGSFIKAARAEAGRLSSDVVRRPIPGFLKPGFSEGAREIDPVSLDEAIRAVLGAPGVAITPDDEVWITGQMAGLAFVDEQGVALAPLISWQDRRYGNVDDVAQAMGAETVSDLGDGLRVGSPAVTLANISPSLRRHATSLLAYVAGRLAGGRAERVHVTDAAAWGLYDTRRLRWAPKAVGAVGLTISDLPEASTQPCPVFDESKVMVAFGDQQAALVGAALQPGEVSVNLATGCQVSVRAEDFTTHVQTRPFPGGDYLHTVTHLPAGRLMASAVEAAAESSDVAAWDWAATEGLTHTEVRSAMATIVEGIGSAVDRLGARGLPVVFSGGLVQQFHPLREAIERELDSPTSRVFPGDDAALAGIAAIAGRSL